MINYHRWPGPTSYNTFNTPVTHSDRPGFRIQHRFRSSIQHTPNLTTTEKAKQRTDHKSNFSTPYKKTEDSSNCGSSTPVPGAGSTPVKGASSGFIPPVKVTSTGFVTPVKEVGETSFRTPVKAGQETVDRAKSGHSAPVLQKEESVTEQSEIGAKQSGSDGICAKYVAVSEEVAKKRLRAKVAQAQRIKQKKDQGGVKPSMGSLLTHKRSAPRLKMRQATQGQTPHTYTKQQVGIILVIDLGW